MIFLLGLALITRYIITRNKKAALSSLIIGLTIMVYSYKMEYLNSLIGSKIFLLNPILGVLLIMTAFYLIINYFIKIKYNA